MTGTPKSAGSLLVAVGSLALLLQDYEPTAYTEEQWIIPPSVACYITQRCDTIAKRARQFWGDGVLEDVQRLRLWRRQAEQR
jgi:hypothetical protein